MIIGIDFGTTNSCVSVFDNDSNKIRVIFDNLGNTSYPTCLYFDKETDDILFGEIAYNLLKSNNNLLFLGNIIHNIKRLVGLNWESFKKQEVLVKFFIESGIDIINNNGECGIQMTYNKVNKIWSIIEIMKLYFRYLKHLLKECCQTDENLDTVITVPAYFTDIQREIILNCCKSSGFNVIRVINEPTSAILAYIWEMNKHDQNFIKKMGDQNHNYLVLDCGGGTTDLSYINIDYEEMFFQVQTVEGDNFLGGQDITNNLVNWICKKIDILNPSIKVLNTISKESERVKQELSFKENTVINLESINEKDYILPISRTKFIEINELFFSKIRNLLKKISETGIPNKILFVGGTTNIPYFIDMCKDIFGKEIEIINTIDKNTCVSIGATVQGAILSGLLEKNSEHQFSDTLLVDIIPMSIGVKTIGDIMSVIIPKGTPIPCERTEYFSNSEDYTNSIDIDIYQGLRKFVNDNFYLGSFILENLDETKIRGEMRIKMIFRVDENGIIKASAEETSSGVCKELVVSKINSKTTNYDDEFNQINYEFLKIDDTERANKIFAKLELYDSFKFLLTRFHEIHYDLQNKNVDLKSKWKKFQIDELNNLFNDTFDIIIKWENYTKDDLFFTKTTFEKNWHKIIYNLMN